MSEWLGRELERSHFWPLLSMTFPVGLTSGLAFSGEALGDFLFSRCLELDHKRLVSLRTMIDFLDGGVSSMANSKPALGFTEVTSCSSGTAGSGTRGAAGLGTQGTTVGAGTADWSTTTLCGAGTGW